MMEESEESYDCEKGHLWSWQQSIGCFKGGDNSMGDIIRGCVKCDPEGKRAIGPGMMTTCDMVACPNCGAFTGRGGLTNNEGYNGYKPSRVCQGYNRGLCHDPIAGCKFADTKTNVRTGRNYDCCTLPGGIFKEKETE